MYHVTLAGSLISLTPDTLFDSNSKILSSLGVTWKDAELLLDANGAWQMSTFDSKVVGVAPTLVLVDLRRSRGRIRGGALASGEHRQPVH